MQENRSDGYNNMLLRDWARKNTNVPVDKARALLMGNEKEHEAVARDISSGRTGDDVPQNENGYCIIDISMGHKTQCSFDL